MGRGEEGKMRAVLLDIFDRLLSAFGQRHWWPGDSPLEIMVGAILTQNTSWRNVERAIDNLKAAGLLDLDALHRIGEERLSEVIKPAGFYRVKSRRLKAFVTEFHRVYGGVIEHTEGVPTGKLRDHLL